ncbi:hypothetical protein AAC387_Pa12g2148 [Persea americana]
MEKSDPSPKMDRKTAEKIRRNQMKELYSKLNSLISNHPSREAPMLSDQLGEAANYIKSMQEKIENMKGRKKHMAETKEIDKSTDSEKMDFQLPHIEIQDLGSALVVLLICGLDYQFVFYRTILILEEEGVEVVNASFFVMGDKAFHTIHCKILDSEDDFEVARVSERLYKLVHESSDNL